MKFPVPQSINGLAKFRILEVPVRTEEQRLGYLRPQLLNITNWWLPPSPLCQVIEHLSKLVFYNTHTLPLVHIPIITVIFLVFFLFTIIKNMMQHDPVTSAVLQPRFPRQNYRSLIMPHCSYIWVSQAANASPKSSYSFVSKITLHFVVIY